MGFQLKQNLKLTQNLMMTPALQQAIKLLQLSRFELEQYVAQQLAENPVLEEGMISSDTIDDLSVAESKEKESTEDHAVNERMKEASELMDQVRTEKDVDWENYSNIHESQSAAKTRAKNQQETSQFNYENFVSKDKTLHDDLRTQISELDFNEREKAIADLIIGNIDERGYLQISLQEVAKHFESTEEEMDDVLDTIQRLEPNGVGARDLKECLLIQLRNNKLKNQIVEKIVEKHLKELETRNFDVIAKGLKISVETVIENVAIIAELEPVPGRPYGGETSQTVIPDVYIFKVGHRWVVSLNDDGLPHLALNQDYYQMLSQNKAKDDEKVYLQDKIKDASWLIKSIQQRQKTIFKVAESLLKYQKDFFEKGVEHLKPLVLKNVSEDIEMHESTVSRVTTNKYVHTPRGIFELKFFFNSAVARTQGDGIASASVRAMIEELIKKEDTKKPLADKKIVEILEEKGIQLARRTVAKYRESLGIPPSSKRKRYY